MKNIFYLLLCAATPAFAFTLGGTSSSLQGWDAKKLDYRVNPSNCPSHVAGALDKALKLWNSVPTSDLRLQRGADTTATGFTSPPTLICSTTFASDTSMDKNFVAGVGSFSTTGDRITSGVLILNVEAGAQANINNMDENILSIIIAHELGHVFGLGHSQEPAALMYYDASAKRHLALAQDDIDGITYLYPRDEFSDPMMGCGSMANAAPPRIPPSITLLTLILPLVVWLRCRYTPGRES